MLKVAEGGRGCLLAAGRRLASGGRERRTWNQPEPGCPACLCFLSRAVGRAVGGPQPALVGASSQVPSLSP